MTLTFRATPALSHRSPPSCASARRPPLSPQDGRGLRPPTRRGRMPARLPHPQAQAAPAAMLQPPTALHPPPAHHPHRLHL
eukprot:2114847-Pleurochrysis_carterae.AAC.1